MNRRWILVASIVVVLALAVGIYIIRWGYPSYAKNRAEAEIAAEDWAGARRHLRRALRLNPSDADARVRLAECLVRDPTLQAEEGLDEALDHLACVPDHHARSVESRLAEARLLLLAAARPYTAEAHLRRALARAPADREANELLWGVLDATRRSEYSEPHFWHVYEAAPPAEKAEVLRLWYLSQFAPGTRNATLDRAVGVLADDVPDTATAFQRLLLFQQQEPDSPTGLAAMAHWFQQESDPEQAWNLLQQASSLPGAWEEPLFVSTLVATCVDLGELERADSYLERWTDPDDAFAYWRYRGMVEENLSGDDRAAVESYREALRHWPGHFVWPLRFRLAQCLERLGNSDAAAAQRETAEKLRELTSRDHQESLRLALADLQQPENLETLADFYAALDRPREAQAWRTAADRL